MTWHLDGKLLDQEEVDVDFFKISREILKAHKNGTEGLLDEVSGREEDHGVVPSKSCSAG